MKTGVLILATTLAMALAACSNDKAANGPAAGAKPAAEAAASAVSADPEFERLKAVKPVEACAWLPLEKLAVVFPGLKFELHQKLDAQLSGYAWDSRCTYWAGVGTVEYAKDVPTHTLHIFVNTPVSGEKANANLASRAETARSATGYQAQAALGANAYSIVNTGVASLFFVKGQSEVQLGFSDLKTPNEEKIKKLIAIAQSL